MKILNFGSMNIDRVYQVKEIVAKKETISSINYIELIGGKGLNQSVALALANATVYHAGKIGFDGQFLKDYMDSKKVKTEFILQSNHVSGHAVIQVDQNGENAIIVHGGSNQEISLQDIDKVLAEFEAEDWLLLQNEISNLDYLIKTASTKGMRIFLNPSPINDSLLANPLELVDTFILNEVEGSRLTSKSDPDGILEELGLRYPDSNFILTLGENGSVYFDGSNKYIQKAYKVNAIDPTGAGDTYTGYFLACRYQDMSIEQSMKYASAASAISVTKLGASNSIPSFNEVSEWLERVEIGECLD